MKYSDDIIQRVKDATDIVSIIGEYVPLKKAGSSYKGLCPFHSEKSPSFMVSPGRGSFHCFGCGKGGNVITFIMEMDKLSFPEALRLLADKAGIVLPKPQEIERDQEQEKARERMQDLNEFACKFFQERLLSAEGRVARDYFKSRGFTKEDALKYRIGYAPAGWDSLKNAAQKAGFSQEELLSSGLIVHNEEKKSFYDKFRDRLIFPVQNNYDKIIAFGGRALSDESGPKYLNSPETLLFKKSECLYLLNEAREAIRQKGYVLVVEGYFDALALHHYGFTNAVATLGTALTPQHGRMLKRYTRDVVFSYDADTAGQAAVQRGFAPLVEAGLNVRVLVMPNAKDPDEYLRKHPKEELEWLIEKAPDFFRWWAASLKKKLTGMPVEEQLRALRDFAPMILQIPDEVSVQAACAAVESELGLDNRDLLTIVNAERKKGFRRPLEPAGANGGEPPAPPQEAAGAGLQLEADFLALLTEEKGEFIPWAANELPPEVFLNESFRRLFEGLSTGETKAEDLNGLAELAPSFMRLEERAEKRKYSAKRDGKQDSEILTAEKRVREAMLADLVKRLKKRHFEHQMNELKRQKDEAEKAGETEKTLNLAQQIYQLSNIHKGWKSNETSI